MPKKHPRPQPHAPPAGIPKPPPIDVTHLPSNDPSSSTNGAHLSQPAHPQPQPPSKRPPPTYPRWAHRRDSPRLARTIHDLALFLSSLPLPLHKYTPRIAARLVARLLQRNNLMASNIAFDIALLFWRCIINIFFRSIQPRGAWRIPTDGPVIFVGAPHHNQVSSASPTVYMRIHIIPTDSILIYIHLPSPLACRSSWTHFSSPPRYAVARGAG